MPETMPPGHVASNKDDLIVCYYYLCIGQIKRDSFAEAKAVVKKLLAIDPKNIQGRQLQTYMEDEEHNRGVKGLVGTVAVVGAAAFAIGAMVFGRRR